MAKLTPEQVELEKVYRRRINIGLLCFFGFVVGYWVLGILVQLIKG
jgi:hypothetical protein